MKFGKLFRGLQREFPEFSNLSSNRCSQLSYAELRNIARTLYNKTEIIPADYMRSNKHVLAMTVYRALQEKYN